MNPFIVGSLIGAGIALIGSIFSDDDNKSDEISQELIDKLESELEEDKQKWRRERKKGLSPIVFKIADVNFRVRESDLVQKKELLRMQSSKD